MDLMNSLETQDKIVYAARTYPEQEYTWKVSRPELKEDLLILSGKGYTFDSGIEMGTDKSEKVIYVYRPIKTITLDVKGDVIKK